MKLEVLFDNFVTDFDRFGKEENLASIAKYCFSFHEFRYCFLSEQIALSQNVQTIQILLVFCVPG